MKLANVSTEDLRRMSRGGLLRALAAEGEATNPYDLVISDFLDEIGEKPRASESLLDALLRLAREALTVEAKQKPKPKQKKPDDAAGMTGLSTRELAICKEIGVDPATYAINKARKEAAPRGR